MCFTSLVLLDKYQKLLQARYEMSHAESYVQRPRERSNKPRKAAILIPADAEQVPNAPHAVSKLSVMLDVVAVVSRILGISIKKENLPATGGRGHWARNQKAAWHFPHHGIALYRLVHCLKGPLPSPARFRSVSQSSIQLNHVRNSREPNTYPECSCNGISFSIQQPTIPTPHPKQSTNPQMTGNA